MGTKEFLPFSNCHLGKAELEISRSDRAPLACRMKNNSAGEGSQTHLYAVRKLAGQSQACQQQSHAQLSRAPLDQVCRLMIGVLLVQ